MYVTNETKIISIYMIFIVIKREFDIGNDFQLFIRYLLCLNDKETNHTSVCCLLKAFERKLTKQSRIFPLFFDDLINAVKTLIFSIKT